MFNSWISKIPWRRAQQPTPLFLPGESHRQRSLEGYSPWDCNELDTTEHLSSSLFVSDSLRPCGLYSPWNSPGQNTGVGSHSLVQGIFPTQGLNSGLLHCRQILYQLCRQESPRILEWVAYTLSCRSSQLRNRVGVSCIAGGFSTS